ncbi:unnamed protein product, partial [Laminaria digitata]
RFYEDDGQNSAWGTDMGVAMDNGSLAGFPMRKASSRFSAGPRSQASFAAHSVAASGRSVQSSAGSGGGGSGGGGRGDGSPSPPFGFGGGGGGGGEGVAAGSKGEGGGGGGG